MRLVRYRAVRAADAEGAVRSGVVVTVDGVDRVVDLGPAALTDLLAADRDALDRAAARADVADLELSAARLEAPVRPGKILCLGYNYRGHVPDGVDPTADDPAFPDIFVKTPNTLAGPADPVVVPAVADDVDYEGEIAVVIGRRAKDVDEATALSHVAGYTILNDVSDRSWQRRQSQWAMGKCFDGFAPLGPWLVTPDEAGDPQDMLVEVVREGVVTVSQSTATTIFSVARVVSYLSSVMTLEPGDVISTGTPQKLPDAQASHRPLRPGDTVTVRIERLGELTTTFIGGPA
ncbi:fumarylacetoacetate hydrolase family protein [Microbacterium sp. NE2HP2]|uniref:fumarylacetoacetate hydrolase family protein n=1 Tax=Microbacterium TaxID=33882 RepID=UPI002366003E|nr:MULTISPECIES: fumarylacetoacetate hydrolase family protein [Microbacterium]MDD7944372.1 fumarylacetoacetate hydrolase family protein [Microbacterium plantarum]WHE36703.1 fumarylacetoacetate hydrolase family protein [Microbacterium sp. BDGP8]